MRKSFISLIFAFLIYFLGYSQIKKNEISIGFVGNLEESGFLGYYRNYSLPYAIIRGSLFPTVLSYQRNFKENDGIISEVLIHQNGIGVNMPNINNSAENQLSEKTTNFFVSYNKRFFLQKNKFPIFFSLGPGFRFGTVWDYILDDGVEPLYSNSFRTNDFGFKGSVGVGYYSKSNIGVTLNYSYRYFFTDPIETETLITPSNYESDMHYIQISLIRSFGKNSFQ